MVTSANTSTTQHTIASVAVPKKGTYRTYSYLADPGTHVGDSVDIEFGHTNTTGIVVDVATATSPGKATKRIRTNHGPITNPATWKVCESISTWHGVPLSTIAVRLQPTATGTPACPPHTCPPPPAPTPVTVDIGGRRHTVSTEPGSHLVAVSPHTSSEHTAADIAQAIASPGTTVLIFCPTSASVTATLKHLPEPATIRLDSRPSANAFNRLRTSDTQFAVTSRTGMLYTPAAVRGYIVVDEHHTGHVDPRSPYLNARDIAVTRGRADTVPVFLISAQPSPQAVGRATTVTDGSCDRGQWPARINIVDRSHTQDPAQWLIPPKMRSALRANARTATTTPLVIAARTSSVRRCRSCRTVRGCEREHPDNICTHIMNTLCPVCQATSETVLSGWDPARLHKLLGDGVTVTTEAALPEQPESELVIIFDVDTALAYPGLDGEARARHLIVAAARACTPDGTLLIVTSGSSAHPLLRDVATRRTVLASSRRSQAHAQRRRLPPYGRLITVEQERKTCPTVRDWPGTAIGPALIRPDVWKTLLLCDTSTLAAAGPWLQRMRARAKTRVTVT